MKAGLVIGAPHVVRYTVPGHQTGRNLFPDLSEFRHSQPVFATGFMVGLMEAPCMAAVYPYLEPGEATVGTLINMTHLSAATPGTSLMAEARATAIHGQTVRFAVAVTDSARDVVAAGEHGLRVVEVARFHDRLEAKRAQLRRLGSSSLPCEQRRLGRQRPHLPAGIEDPPDRLGDLGDLGDLGEHPPQDVLAALALVHRDVAGAGAAYDQHILPGFGHGGGDGCVRLLPRAAQPGRGR